jgi:hypothetical protein
MQDSQDCDFRRRHAKDDDVATNRNGSDVAPKVWSRLGGLGRALQQTKPVQHIHPKTLRSAGILLPNAIADPFEISPRSLTENNLSHFMSAGA